MSLPIPWHFVSSTYSQIKNKEEWTINKSDAFHGVLIWNKTPDNLIVTISDGGGLFNYRDVEFCNSTGTIAIIKVPNDILQLYINENPVFIEKLLIFLTEMSIKPQIDAHDFVEQIKKLARHFSTKQTILACKRYMHKEKWEIAPITESYYIGKLPAYTLGNSWNYTNSKKLCFCKKKGEKIATIVTSVNYCSQKPVEISFTNLRNTVVAIRVPFKSYLSSIENEKFIITMLSFLDEIIENDSIDTQYFFEHISSIAKDYIPENALDIYNDLKQLCEHHFFPDKSSSWQSLKKEDWVQTYKYPLYTIEWENAPIGTLLRLKYNVAFVFYQTREIDELPIGYLYPIIMEYTNAVGKQYSYTWQTIYKFTDYMMSKNFEQKYRDLLLEFSNKNCNNMVFVDRMNDLIKQRNQ